MNKKSIFLSILIVLFCLLLFGCDNNREQEEFSTGPSAEWTDFLKSLDEGNVIFDGTGTVTLGECKYPATIWLGIYAPIDAGGGHKVNPVYINALGVGFVTQSPCTPVGDADHSRPANGFYEKETILFETCSLDGGASGVAQTDGYGFIGSYTCRYIQDGVNHVGYKVEFSAYLRK